MGKMEPMTITAIAISIAKAVGLTDWVGRKLGGKPGEMASRKIVEVAGSVVGGDTPKEILEKLTKSPELGEAVKQQIIEAEPEILSLELADIKDARNLYRAKSTQANQIAKIIMWGNLPAILVLIAANVYAAHVVTDPSLAVAIGNVAGASISWLWTERQQVVGFFFGSSIGSKINGARLARNRFNG